MAERHNTPIQLVQGVLTLSAPLWPTIESFALNGQTTLSQLQQWLVVATPTVAYLTGSRAAGKTHLAQAFLAQQSQQGVSCVYMSAKETLALNPERIQGLEQLSLVCIDDADLLLKQAVWLSALQSLVKRMRDTGSCLLLVQRSSQQVMGLEGSVFSLATIQDETMKRQLLVDRAKLRDVMLPLSVINWLMKNFSDDLGQLMHVLDYLIHGALTLKHPITLPFAKKILLQN